jgi:outer membrane protein assembly factor BamB
MMRKRSIALILLASSAGAAAAADWPQWRGPELRGTSPETKLPVKWSLTEGVAWKLAMPTGSGATPIVSGDRIYLNVADGDTVSLWCLDRKTSAVLWKKPLGPSAGHAHKKHNMSTP